MKFEIYADAYQWTNVQKRAKLCWAMTGTAGKYCSAIIRREKNIAFEELVNRMEKRFILCKLVATVQVQFNNARQSEIEDIDEWADRLLALALKAFRDLPDEYVIKQVVIKLCQGCIDKSIGSVAASFQPKSVEGALERIKWLQHSNQTIFGGTVRTKDPSNETDNTDVSVNVTKPEETTTKVMEKRMDSIKSVIQDTMKTVHENIDKVQSNVDKVHTDVRSLEQMRRKELNSALEKVKPKTANEPNINFRQPDNWQDRQLVNRNNFQCWNCQGYGHVARFCRQPKRKYCTRYN